MGISYKQQICFEAVFTGCQDTRPLEKKNAATGNVRSFFSGQLRKPPKMALERSGSL
jgi:hypothetical protein